MIGWNVIVEIGERELLSIGNWNGFGDLLGEESEFVEFWATFNWFVLYGWKPSWFEVFWFDPNGIDAFADMFNWFEVFDGKFCWLGKFWLSPFIWFDLFVGKFGRLLSFIWFIFMSEVGWLDAFFSKLNWYETFGAILNSFGV